MGKRKREDAALDASEREAKTLKREMRQRGHVVMDPPLSPHNMLSSSRQPGRCSVVPVSAGPSRCRGVKLGRACNGQAMPAAESVPVMLASCTLLQAVAKKGEDPERDAREKALSRLATRRVLPPLLLRPPTPSALPLPSIAPSLVWRRLHARGAERPGVGSVGCGVLWGRRGMREAQSG